MKLTDLLTDSAYKLPPEEAVRQLYLTVLKDDLGYPQDAPSCTGVSQ